MPGQRRYDRVKEQLDNVPKDKLKMCQSKGACACTGCVNALGVRSSELKWYKETYVETSKEIRKSDSSKE